MYTVFFVFLSFHDIQLMYSPVDEINYYSLFIIQRYSNWKFICFILRSKKFTLDNQIFNVCVFCTSLVILPLRRYFLSDYPFNSYVFIKKPSFVIKISAVSVTPWSLTQCWVSILKIQKIVEKFLQNLDNELRFQISFNHKKQYQKFREAVFKLRKLHKLYLTRWWLWHH